MTEDRYPEFEETPSDSVERVDVGDEPVGIAWGLIAFLIVVVLFIAFIVQNPERVTVEFLWLDMQLPIWVIVVTIVLLTLALDQIISYFYRRRKRRQRAESLAREASD